LANKFAQLKQQLNEWQLLAPLASEPDHFMRNKAKMAVGGDLSHPVLGIPERAENPIHHIDACPIHHPEINQLLQKIPALMKASHLTPYQIAQQKGELKFVLVNRAAGTGELMLRFVLRSKEALDRLKIALPEMLKATPQLKVVSVNLQPLHTAVIEGPEEIFLTSQTTINAHIGEAQLLLGPGSFFQTNDAVATQLYKLAADQCRQSLPPNSLVLDLFCGVGGFAQHLALAGLQVHGFEYSSQAIELARLSHKQHPLLSEVSIHFSQLDLDKQDLAPLSLAQAVVINPPRRGLSAHMIKQLVQTPVKLLLYSSCNPESLKRDLQLLSAKYQVESMTPLDMFPWTTHWECLAVLRA
jgi:23S rRNA (uracil747-C5)-methyltransferase